MKIKVEKGFKKAIFGVCACMMSVLVLGGCAQEEEEILTPDAIVQYMPSEETGNSDEGDDVSQSSEENSQVGNVGEGEQTETESTESSESSEQEESSVPEESSEPEPVLVENPYTDYFKQNSDMVAWLNIPGMAIDYPVMQTPGNEEYYLRKDFNKKKDNNGCLILDTDSSIDPIGTNLMIHGHNMKSGKMFGTLMEYKDKDFYEEHQIITLYTKEVQKNYQVMAVFYSQVYKKSDNVFKFYKFFQADTEKEFNNFYDNIMDLAIYDTGVTAEFGDNFVTLVTCSYHVDNGRFVVVAKEIEDGDYYLPIE